MNNAQPPRNQNRNQCQGGQGHQNQMQLIPHNQGMACGHNIGQPAQPHNNDDNQGMGWRNNQGQRNQDCAARRVVNVHSHYV